jgi:hypothetical protein
VCEYASLPGYKWGSASDQTGNLPGLVCTPLEKPLPGGSLHGWLEWAKIAQLIESLPP